MFNNCFGHWQYLLNCVIITEQQLGLKCTLLSFTNSQKYFSKNFFSTTFFCNQGIPTLLMAAGSFDDILAITGFSTCLGIAFSTGELRGTIPSWFSVVPSTCCCCPAGSMWMNVLKGLLEVVGGIVAGLILGLFLCWFPSKDQVRVV